MNSQTLRFEISTFWHAGTGRGRGGAADAVTCKDAHGLPRLPGRTVKGLLRDAVEQAERLGWFSGFALAPGITERLFGQASETHGESSPGVLRVGDAVLPADVTAHLRDADNSGLIAGLYRVHYSTAVDAEGSARDGSLRGVEVTVPLTLFAPVSVLPSAEADDYPWTDILETALPLIQAVGAHRTRGFGRACVTLEKAA